MSIFEKLLSTLLGQSGITSFDGEHGIPASTRTVLDSRVAGKLFEIPRHPRIEPSTVENVLKNRQRKARCLLANASSLEALKVMAEDDVGAVLVLEAGSLVGIFSERDYARNSIRTAQAPATLPLREVMTPCAMFASPTDSVQQCLTLMMEHRLHYLPVQEAGELIGILSREDLLYDMVEYLERVSKESQLDQQVASLRGTYSC
jgi:predicted transcriptional regulator